MSLVDGDVNNSVNANMQGRGGVSETGKPTKPASGSFSLAKPADASDEDFKKFEKGMIDQMFQDGNKQQEKSQERIKKIRQESGS